MKKSIRENLCEEVNCAGMTRAFFLSHCGVRDVRLESCHTKDQILLTTKLRKKQRSTRRTAHEVRWSRDNNKPVSTGACHRTDTDNFFILSGSQNIPPVYEFTYVQA